MFYENWAFLTHQPKIIENFSIRKINYRNTPCFSQRKEPCSPHIFCRGFNPDEVGLGGRLMEKSLPPNMPYLDYILVI